MKNDFLEIIPAIDILNGKCVRLTQGQYDKVEEFSSNPLEIAKKWADCGARRLHIVDLDGARAGHPVNHKVITKIVRSTDIKIEVKGYGPGISDHKLQAEAMATVVSSEVAAKGAVEFEAAKMKIALKKVVVRSRSFRNPDSIMFQKRDEYYRNNRPMVMLSIFANPEEKSDDDIVKLSIDLLPNNTPTI